MTTWSWATPCARRAWAPGSCASTAPRRPIAFTSDVTPRYVRANPYEGGKQAVAEAYRNLTAAGARPLASTDNLNFGNPEKPEIMGQFVGAIRGIGEACRALDMPIVSGNVSLYNETDGRAILPTPTIGAVGLIENLSEIIGPDPRPATGRWSSAKPAATWASRRCSTRSSAARRATRPRSIWTPSDGMANSCATAAR
jgi:phosphoribosylformylglycinamidine (FGAM) synthase-like enzyme